MPPPKRRPGEPDTARPAGKPAPPTAPKPAAGAAFTVSLPAGGTLSLQDADEATFWKETSKRYIDDYGITKSNDLVLLGAILSQAVVMYRSQRDMADPKKSAAASKAIASSAAEIRELEKALGLDKRTREAGGQHTVADYVTRLKRAAHMKGVRISERVKAYEAFNMELRWKLRLLANGDDEDRRYHDVSPEKICKWAEGELAKLEEADKEWAREKGSVFVGKL